MSGERTEFDEGDNSCILGRALIERKGTVDINNNLRSVSEEI